MSKLISEKYAAWKAECEERFLQLKKNEEELNRIFIEIYGLQDELTPDVAEKDVTVHRIFDTKEDVPEGMRGSNYVRTMRDEIVSLISYAVGCMFGRYSLDVEGLAYAGGEWDASKYSTFLPDADNVLPITDEEYLEDDVVGLFCAWLKKVYGADTLEQNLDFVASALGGKGNTSREVIRGYFLKDFFADHCKTYQKRPIYWLFDRGSRTASRRSSICIAIRPTRWGTSAWNICIGCSAFTNRRSSGCRIPSIILLIRVRRLLPPSGRKSLSSSSKNAASTTRRWRTSRSVA